MMPEAFPSPPPLWTSTQFQNWKADCAKHITQRQPFEVQDVYRPEHETFCILVCEQNHYAWQRKKLSIFCAPTDSNPAGAPSGASESEPPTPDQPQNNKCTGAPRPNFARLGRKTARTVLRG